MAEPLRWRLLVAVLDALRKITPANGYHSTPQSVEIGLRHVLQLKVFPSLCLVDGSGSTRPGTIHGRRSNRMAIRVHCFVSGSSAVPRELALARAEEDIYRCLAEEHARLDGLAVGIHEAEPDETDEGVLGLLGTLPGSEGELVKSFVVEAMPEEIL